MADDNVPGGGIVNYSGPGRQGVGRVSGVDQNKLNVPLVSDQAFQNPVGNQAESWKQGMANMLDKTTGPAAQMQAASGGQAAQLGAGQYNQSWLAQGNLANQLGAMAVGQGPSMAQVQAQQSAQQGLANQMAMLGSQRGAANPALAAYQAQQMGAQGMQQAAQQAVQGRTQEEMQALQAQGALLGNMNQQAQGFAGSNAQLLQNQAQFNAGLQQQANQGNLQAQMSQQALNAQQYDNYMSMLQQMNMQQYQAAMAQQQLESSNYLTASGIEAGVGINQANMEANMAGSIAGGAAGTSGIIAQAFSDRAVKQKVTSGQKQLGQMLDKIYAKPGALKLLMLL